MSDLSPPNLTPYARFVRLTCLSNSMRTAVITHLFLRHIDQCMGSLCSRPKPLTVHGRPDQNCQFSRVWVPPCMFSAFSFSACGPSVLNVTECLGFLHFNPICPVIVHQNPPLFPDPGLPRATFTSCVVSMGLDQRALTEVLIVPCWLPLPLVQGVFDRCFGFL